MRSVIASHAVVGVLLGLGSIVPRETVPIAADCDSPAVEIQLGQDVRSAIQATTRPYPATATYYCVVVPAGTRRVTMTLGGMTTDLDLYVGHGSIRTVQGVDLSAGQNYQWKSNDFGTGDERVVIERPQAGTYYIEIASYEGAGSNFTFRAIAG